MVQRLQSEAQLRVVDGIVLGGVVDVWDLADVVLLLLLAVEGLLQQQEPLRIAAGGSSCTGAGPVSPVSAASLAAEAVLFHWRLQPA